MPFIRIGRPTLSVGHKLHDIIARLPNHGVGRLITNSVDEMHYTEPSFYKVVAVLPKEKDDDKHKLGVKLEYYTRCQYTGTKVMRARDAKLDNFSLVPRDRESYYLDAVKNYKPLPMVVLPRTVAVPPLLKLHLQQRHNLSVDRIPLQPPKPTLYVRQAEEGEEPNVHKDEVDGIGSTRETHLYDGIDLTESTYPPHPDTPMPPPSLRLQLPETPREPPMPKSPMPSWTKN